MAKISLDFTDLHRIALLSKEAGEALPRVKKARGRDLSALPYKYGHHWGNWTDGGSAGLERELEATLPSSALFMDNVKGAPLQLQLERLAAKGVYPILIYRPYFIPSSGIGGAAIENYANGAVIRFRDEYLPHPLIRKAYDEGRFVAKLFNETNIGGEGFARGRAGFADALRCWKQARAIFQNAFPKTKQMSIANTPGNDDVWFTGDVQNAPYWYHGPQAAKANPTQAEIQAAIASCPFKEMFELCDYIGIHVYANLTSTVSGNLQTWYSRRHEQALKFLGPYIAQGKKMIISECDMGYDDGQEARARDFVWWMRNIVGTNPAILTVNHWWNSDDGEGAITWEKHQTRKGGEFRPVVNAIKDYRADTSGQVPPVDPPTEPPTTPPTTPPREVINQPAWVSFVEPTVAVNAEYFELTRFRFVDEAEAQGKVNIFILDPHNPNLRIRVTNTGTGTVAEIPLNKPAGEPAANVPMFGIGNVYDVEMLGLPSVKVKGMQLPGNRHVFYELTFAKRVKQGTPPPPPNTLETALWTACEAVQIPVNRTFALPKALIATSQSLGDNGLGLDVVCPEVTVTHEGLRYKAQMGQRWSDNFKALAYCRDGDWNNVRVIRK